MSFENGVVILSSGHYFVQVFILDYLGLKTYRGPSGESLMEASPSPRRLCQEHVLALAGRFQAKEYSRTNEVECCNQIG